jgi:polyhydroxyalkanoate synthesis regulator phasin
MSQPDYFTKAAIAEAASHARMRTTRQSDDLRAYIQKLEKRIKKLEKQIANS